MANMNFWPKNDSHRTVCITSIDAIFFTEDPLNGVQMNFFNIRA